MITVAIYLLAALGAIRVLRLARLALKACGLALRNALRAVVASAENPKAASKAETADPAIVAAVLEALRAQKRCSTSKGN